VGNVLFSRLGRRTMLLMTQLMTALTCGAALLVGAQTGSTALVAFCTAAKFGTTAAFAVVLLQVMELFPTTLRNTAIGSCSLASRVGGVLAPIITNLGPGYDHVPLLFFTFTSAAAFLSALMLTETVGRPLPATIAEAEAADASPKNASECLSFLPSKTAATATTNPE